MLNTQSDDFSILYLASSPCNFEQEVTQILVNGEPI